MALTHAELIAGKLEALRVEFEWVDGAFHVFRQRKRLPKDRRDVHGAKIRDVKKARTVFYSRMYHYIYIYIYIYICCTI